MLRDVKGARNYDGVTRRRPTRPPGAPAKLADSLPPATHRLQPAPAPLVADPKYDTIVTTPGGVTLIQNSGNAKYLRVDGMSQLVYKHAISTVQPENPVNFQEAQAEE